MIELAIVLVIIGLILGSVLKGRDMINSAKQKHFYNSFIKAWKLSVVSYRDRTGQLLGDGRINGGTTTNPNGRFDGIDNNADFDRIEARLQAVGLEAPASNAANNNRYNVQGAFTAQRVELEMVAIGNRNVFRLRNMPTDMAIALDTIIDGQMNAQAGTFRQHPVVTTDYWPNASGSTYRVDAFVIL